MSSARQRPLTPDELANASTDEILSALVGVLARGMARKAMREKAAREKKDDTS